jgi:hypothetical protein
MAMDFLAGLPIKELQNIGKKADDEGPNLIPFERLWDRLGLDLLLNQLKNRKWPEEAEARHEWKLSKL